MKHWLQGLAPRERHLIVGAAVVLAVLVAYLAVVEPLLERRAYLERSVAAQRATLAWMKQAVAPLEGAQPAQRAGANGSLFAVVDRSARATVLAGPLQRVQPEGDGNVRVWFEDAPFDDLVRWLGTLQSEHAITVRAMSVERTAAAGRVDARLTLERAL